MCPERPLLFIIYSINFYSLLKWNNFKIDHRTRCLWPICPKVVHPETEESMRRRKRRRRLSSLLLRTSSTSGRENPRKCGSPIWWWTDHAALYVLATLSSSSLPIFPSSRITLVSPMNQRGTTWFGPIQWLLILICSMWVPTTSRPLLVVKTKLWKAWDPKDCNRFSFYIRMRTTTRDC